jgi:hypothetical protein
MNRIERSFLLVGRSCRILGEDIELMLLPLLSGIVMSAVVMAAIFGFGVDTALLQTRGSELYVPLFVVYVALYAVGLFFQCAVVAGATERMRGGDPTLRSALAAAGRRIVRIVLWAFFAATVGVALRAVRDRVGILGKVVVAMLGAAWSLATFFVVPILVLEDLTLGEVLGRSVGVFKEAWGESMVGGAGLGIAAFCAWLGLALATALLASAIGMPALIFFGTGAILLSIFFSALNGVYLATLYQYATEGTVATGFDRHLLKDAFVRKD